MYIDKTKDFRQDESQLSLRFIKPHEAVSTQTVSRWILEVLGPVGIDTKTFSGHSTRSPSSSKAISDDVAMGEVLKRGFWSSLLNRVPCVPACQRGRHANVLACQRGLHANAPIACQLLVFTCQRAITRANFSTWRANVLKSVPIFQAFLLLNTKGNFYTLLLYKKFYIILDIILIHILCVYVSFIKIVLDFISRLLYFIHILYSNAVFSCEICEIFKNTYFEEHLQTTASNSIVVS